LHSKPADILLIRHGEPDVDWTVSVDVAMFEQWTRSYDLAPLQDTSQPPAEVRHFAAEASRLFCSTLARSLESCSLAAGEARSAESSPLFNEVKLVMPPLRSLRISPSRWVTMAGIFWRFGYSRGVESRSAVRSRAEAGAELLVTAALREQAPVVLFGHGAINRFLMAALQRQGWVRAASCANSRGYWGWTHYVPRGSARLAR
jgi:broad specificity phosphatase PhoE